MPEVECEGSTFAQPVHIRIMPDICDWGVKIHSVSAKAILKTKRSSGRETGGREVHPDSECFTAACSLDILFNQVFIVTELILQFADSHRLEMVV